ncbi:mitochondrial import inner membrane translocase subunit Tim8 B isoform X1 [Kogia breviceps]|uniref:mitochondrial import inner membrane translocase subunit Tim8 B isoform X1 n=1 Tax=Kogia breviceps TaxID=27615 RepID=UPI0034D3338D
MKRSCSAWWRPNSRRRSSLHRSRALRQNARPLSWFQSRPLPHWISRIICNNVLENGRAVEHYWIKVHHFMELCWDKCVEKPGNRLDSRTENCLSSCVDRFIDTTLAITSRFAQIVQKGGQ